MNARTNTTKLKAEPAATPSLADLIATATKASVTRSELLEVLSSARALAATATDDVERAERAYRGSLLSDEATLATAGQERQAATIRRDRAHALVEALESRLDEVETEDAEQARRARYAEAKAKSAAAMKVLRAEYPGLARRIREVLRQLAEAEKAVDTVNADLPAGADHLSSPEHSVRSRLGRPKLVLSERVVELWCKAYKEEPLPEPYQSQVRPSGGGKGSWTLGPEAGSLVSRHATPCVLRRFKRVESLPATFNAWADPLAGDLSLPGLTHFDDDFWHRTWTHGSGDPDLVLSKLAETESEGDSRVDLDTDDREPQVEFIPYDGDEPAADALTREAVVAA